MLKNILLITIIALFTGCSTVQPRPTIIVKDKLMLVEIPDSMLKSCIVPRPPEKEAYIVLSYASKERTLTTYVMELLTTIRKCNMKLNSIRELQIKQQTLLGVKP